MGRDLCYDRWSCDLLLAASSPEVYRLNLEQVRRSSMNRMGIMSSLKIVLERHRS